MNSFGGFGLSALSVGLVLGVAPHAGRAQTPTHPLDGLSGEELASVVRILERSGNVDPTVRYHIINLKEPAKPDVLSWQPGDTFHREAFVVARRAGRTYESVVDLVDGRVTRWEELEGVQPNMLEEEFVRGSEAVRNDPDWQAAMLRRGIRDFDAIHCAPVTPGYFGIGEEEGRRLGKAFCFDTRETQNFWGRPIEGLIALVDLDRFEVVRVIDSGPVPVPDAPVDYDEASVGNLREIVAPISIEQPAGAGFQVRGQSVTWQKWNLHFRIDPRVGLVISTVSYLDAGTTRSVLYQGSLSEIFVPYMDPDVGWYWRTYLDAGEFLVGLGVSSLERGVDCPTNARYFDAVFADDTGAPRTTPRAACIFERYAGDVAWRHFDSMSGRTETRKKRDLVLRLVSTLGNYDYTFDWIFQQDGTIRVAVGASGMEQVKAVRSRTARDAEAREDSAYGRFVGEHTVAINHDHFFNFRLDLDVDGTQNSFVRDDLRTRTLEPDHPRRSVWTLETQVAKAEQEARLRIDLERPALWRVIDSRGTGPLGYPASYQIKPGANVVSLLLPEDFPQRRAGFTDYHLWVTPRRPDERFAAGDHPAQNAGGDGLPAWTSENRAIENTDLVVWYTMGVHHVVRAEDWPVLPTSWLSFELRPFDFFERNPALDLPAGSR